MKPSDRIKQEIEMLANYYEEYFAVLGRDRTTLVEWVTRIVDEAVRDAILTTAGVFRDEK